VPWRGFDATTTGANVFCRVRRAFAHGCRAGDTLDLQSAMSLARAYERRLAVATTDSESTSSLESNTTTSSVVLHHGHASDAFRQKNWPLSEPTESATTAQRSTSMATSASPRACTCSSWTMGEILGQQPQTWVSTSCSRARGQALCRRGGKCCGPCRGPPGHSRRQRVQSI
jgi:hypothetical protein